MSSPRQALDCDQRFEVRFNPVTATINFIAELALFAMGVWMLTLGQGELASHLDPENRWMAPLLPWVVIVLFGPMSLAAARSVLDRRPQIVLTSQGFYWRRWSKAEIPWSEIGTIKFSWRNRSGRYITLTLRDRARYRPDGFITRLLWKIRRIGRLGDIAIPMVSLNRKPKDILEAMERFRERAIRPDLSLRNSPF